LFWKKKQSQQRGLAFAFLGRLARGAAGATAEDSSTAGAGAVVAGSTTDDSMTATASTEARHIE
jgi:hypothetical protein